MYFLTPNYTFTSQEAGENSDLEGYERCEDFHDYSFTLSRPFCLQISLQIPDPIV
jgi:hypothetical protein